jgi:hypothetical protein
MEGEELLAEKADTKFLSSVGSGRNCGRGGEAESKPEDSKRQPPRD